MATILTVNGQKIDQETEKQSKLESQVTQESVARCYAATEGDRYYDVGFTREDKGTIDKNGDRKFISVRWALKAVYTLGNISYFALCFQGTSGSDKGLWVEAINLKPSMSYGFNPVITVNKSSAYTAIAMATAWDLAVDAVQVNALPAQYALLAYAFQRAIVGEVSDFNSLAKLQPVDPKVWEDAKDELKRGLPSHYASLFGKKKVTEIQSAEDLVNADKDLAFATINACEDLETLRWFHMCLMTDYPGSDLIYHLETAIFPLEVKRLRNELLSENLPSMSKEDLMGEVSAMVNFQTLEELAIRLSKIAGISPDLQDAFDYASDRLNIFKADTTAK